MSARDELLGIGVFREDVSLDAIEAAQADALAKAEALAWELNNRAANEKLHDAEVDLINAVSVLEGYKLKPWSKHAEGN